MRVIALASLTALSTSLAYGQSPSVPAPSKFLCIVEFVGGLHYDNQRQAWGATQFKSGHKYIVRRSTPEDAQGKYAGVLQWAKKSVPAWLIFDVDSAYTDLPIEQCSDPSESSYTTALACGTAYEFDPQTLRFQHTYEGGYMPQGSALYEKEHPTPLTNKSVPATQAYEQFMREIDHPDDASFSIGKCAPF